MSDPLESLKRAVVLDQVFAWGLHCNIAVPIWDELECSHRDANLAAKTVMQNLFGINVGHFREWKEHAYPVKTHDH